MGADSWGPVRGATRGLAGVWGSDTEGMSVTGRIKSNARIRELPDTPPTLTEGLKG